MSLFSLENINIYKIYKVRKIPQTTLQNMNDKEIPEKYYEDLVIKKSVHYDEILQALDIVKKYIMRNERIITGGMSIDFALKLKNHKGIYDDDALPDYDFFSPAHHVDAYEIGLWLYRKGFRNISIINALHPSSMRVRVNFNVVADITYVPKAIFDNIPTLKYKGYAIIHPHAQMIDQHRALSFPYENTPWETIMSSRPHKDMKRYELLYGQYPLHLFNVDDKSIQLKEYDIPTELLQSQCVTGFFALNFWVDSAKKMGYKTDIDLGKFAISADKISYSLPIDSHGISLYSDNIQEVYKLIKNVYKPREERFYNRFLDKLPRKIILDNRWELLENNQKIAAHKEFQDVHIANLQNVMMYLLTNYILLMRIKNIKRGYSFYIGYIECRNLIAWAADKYYSSTHEDVKSALKRFLPTAETYGERNLGESFIAAKHRFSIKNKEIDNPAERTKYAQPNNVYDRDMQYSRLNKRLYAFNTNTSEIFNFAGEECASFIV